VGEVNQFSGRIVETDGTMARIETAHGALLGRNPAGLEKSAPAILFVRPEQVGFGAGYSNRFDARLLRRDLEGAFVNYQMQTPTGARMSLHQTNTGAPHVTADDDCQIGFDGEAAVLLPEGPVARTGAEVAAQ
jgi:spermidine/putrescine transport system ATP-binding protein